MKFEKFKINTQNFSSFFINSNPFLFIKLCILLFILSGCTPSTPQIKTNDTNTDINAIISDLAKQISSTMLVQNKRKVAVMDFPLLTGEMTEFGVYLSDKLTSSLFQYNDKFEVVERKHLDSVFKEIELTLTGKMDDNTAQTIGKVLGADTIVIGTVADLGYKIDINLRLLATEQAKVLAVASSIMNKDDAVKKLLETKYVNQKQTKRITRQNNPENEKKFNDFISILNEAVVTYPGKKNIAVIIDSKKTENGFSPENTLYNLLRTEKINIVLNLFKEKLFKAKGFFKEIYDGDTEFLKEANALLKIDSLILGTLTYSFRKSVVSDTNLTSCDVVFNFKVINKNGDIVKNDSIRITGAGFSEDGALNQGIKMLAEKYSDKILN